MKMLKTAELSEDLQNSEFQLNIEEALPIYSQYWNKLKVGTN